MGEFLTLKIVFVYWFSRVVDNIFKQKRKSFIFLTTYFLNPTTELYDYDNIINYWKIFTHFYTNYT